MAEDPRERLIRYLQDAHSTEVGVRKSLEGFVNDSEDPTTRSMFQEHIVLTQSQEERLEARLRAYDETPSGGKGFFNSLMAKMGEMMQGAHDEYDKVTQNVIKAYAAEHLEVGMYESLYAYAKAIGDEETAMLARQIQQEEKQTAERLFPMIEQCAVNAVAATSERRGEGRAYPM